MAIEARHDVLWIGQPRGEFVAPRARLAEFPDVSVVERSDMGAAAQWLIEQPATPVLVIVTQSRPGEVALAEIDRLRRAAPLARIVGLLGTWCEGETRSGHPWPAVERVYWHQWPSWIDRELRALRSDPASGWTMPLTATPEERLLAAARHVSCGEAAPPRGGIVVIISSHRASAEMLSEAAARHGLRPVCTDQAPAQLTGVSLALWDGDRCSAQDTAQLHALVGAVRPAPVMAMLTFPRWEECQRALAAGVRQVFSKPLCLDDLFAED